MFPAKGEIERIERPISDLEASAHTCKYCRIIVCILEEIDIEAISSFFIIPAIDWGALMPWAPRGSIVLNITWKSKSDYPNRKETVRSWAAFAIRTLAGVSETDYNSILVPGVVNTGSDASLAWVTDKIKACKESHRKCNVHAHGALPDRIVKIGRADSAQACSDENWYESDVKLYETCNEDLPYAALSHRWGDEQPLRLLKDNLELFRENIEWSTLPKTFQDAIVFARKLGIEFIWIDSLCIIQDSKEDWFEQSGKMAGIYEHAAVTLALIEEYTALDLTFASDRVAAIAGVAKQFRRGLKNKTYLAGLWEESLITGMTWQRACPREKRVRPAGPSEGPSWSWLSVAGPIKYPTSRYVGQAPGSPPIVEQVSFRHDNDLEFMRLWGGAVTLHGKLVEAKLRMLYTSNAVRSTVFAPGREGMYDVELDYEPDEGEFNRAWRTVQPRWSQKVFEGDASEVYHLPDNEDMDEKLPFYMKQEDYIGTKQCIRVVYCFWMGVRMEEGSRNALFLVLDCKDKSKQVYTRLGLGVCSPEATMLRGEGASMDEVPVVHDTQSITII
ncbi:uncharacterized protein N0V89_009991 [Didymosphaeria variabile]|uniref:Heterokaryon incompatibility domain-containing protein n=1 Tax=Didymosphaeria variabile TaxID=1932322 RepID=A0A9W9C7T2_9PLEO|nr:uncharacterized protein N0V89_009991 [Didymosphaeria variabile]KAJ4348613.1 hypothetical protein N0V89_009991 [Didymosphaeria variabile]